MKLHIVLLFMIIALVSATPDVSIIFPQASVPKDSEAQEPLKSVESAISPLKEMTYHVANLGLKTLRNLLTSHSNVIISPVNVYSCLGILNLGAVGETKEELRRVLIFPSKNKTRNDILKTNSAVSYASALFLDYGFKAKKEFLDATMAEFQASVLNMNVSDGERAKDLINSWVSDHTNGTIVDLLQERLDPDTRMVVVSALLFKSKWLHSFPTTATAVGKFELEDRSVDVPFMHLLAAVPLVRNSYFDAISLPYVDTYGMTMYVILPKAKGILALKKFLSHLNPNSLRKLREESKSEEIFIILPKMKIEGRFSLTDSLKKQGISAMFSPSKANFTDIVENSSNLFVSEIYQSVHFEIDEEGTAASAATASILTKSNRFVFRANRPFIFVVADEFDFVLFMGVIVNPVP